MFSGIKCIDRRIDQRLEEQHHAITEGHPVTPEEHTNSQDDCPYHIHPRMLWQAKLKKRTLQKGALVFNQSAKEGIKYLQEAELIPDPASPADIAHFLRYTPGLDKNQIGEYLGKNTDENKATLKEYVRTFDFHSISLLTALRMFLDTFRLPGEAQQIDRIMETFAQHAYEQTTEHDLLINPDVTYCVCFSIIMLNTDLHNPNMKPERRMQLKDFIKLNKSYGEMNQGRELTEDFLVTIYKSIASEQIFTSSAATNDTLRNEQWVNVIRQSQNSQSQQFIGHSALFFQNCTHCSAGMYDRDIFSILWGPQLAAAGALLEVVHDHRQLEFALDNFVTLAHIGAFLNMSTVLDSLVYFLSKFSRITTEYVTEEGENDPIEFVVRLGEKASAQLSLISLLGIVRKLGNNLGKSWEEIMHVLCHLYFLGLFDVIDLVHHQCILLSDNERVDFVTMVDGLVEERYSTRKGLLSRLFAWNPEEDEAEQNIQMAPIDSQLWGDLRQSMHKAKQSPVHSTQRLDIQNGNNDDSGSRSNSESESYDDDYEEEDQRHMREEDGTNDVESSTTTITTEVHSTNTNQPPALPDSGESDDYDYDGDDYSEYDSEDYEEDDGRERGEVTTSTPHPPHPSNGQKSTISTTKPISEEVYEYDDDLSDGEGFTSSTTAAATATMYDLSEHDSKCIQNVLECVDKCRLDLFFSSSLEWSTSTLQTVMEAAIHFAKQPYRRYYLRELFILTKYGHIL